MLFINKLTSDAQQQVTLTGIPGQQITMTLRYMPRVQRWIMGVSYGTVSIQGVAVVTSLNLLRQFKNTIPFGIACVRTDGLDPYLVTDFADLSATLYLLNAVDVAQVESDWFT